MLRTIPPKVWILALLIGAGSAGAAPMTFTSALPVADGEFLLRLQLASEESHMQMNTPLDDRTVDSVTAILGYGVSERLALFAELPYAERTVEMGGMQREGSGRGDVILTARYTTHQRKASGEQLRLAPFIGVKLPTGEDDQRDAMGLLPVSAQPGSGSQDYLFGVAGMYRSTGYLLDSQLAVRLNGEANGFEAGDVVRVDGSLLIPWQTPGSGVLYGVVESNLIMSSMDKVGGVSDLDSGGVTLLIVPGLQYATGHWRLDAGLEWPICHDFNGEALEMEKRWRAGIQLNF